MLKPDGYEKNLLQPILHELEKLGMTVIDTNTLHLSPTCIKDLFIHQHDLFLDYITRNNVTAVLLKGENIFHKLRLSKPVLRKHFGGGEVENILHSSEAGNEYDIQVQAFFPERDIQEICLYADLYAKPYLPTDPTEFRQKFKQIRQSANTKAVAFVLPAAKFDVLHGLIYNEVMSSYATDLHTTVAMEYYTRFEDFDCKLVGYYPLGTEISNLQDHQERLYTDIRDVISLIKSSNGSVYLAPITHMFAYDNEAFGRLQDLGLEGGIVYHPRYTLKETDYLREMIRGRGMSMIGGSGGIAPFGRFGMSYEIFSVFLHIVYTGIEEEAEWIDTSKVLV